MPGNPAFLAQLSARVRDAEMDLIFIINFDFNIEVPSTMAIYELRELGLTEAVAGTDGRVRAVRELAVKTASLRLVACLQAKSCLGTTTKVKRCRSLCTKAVQFANGCKWSGPQAAGWQSAENVGCLQTAVSTTRCCPCCLNGVCSLCRQAGCMLLRRLIAAAHHLRQHPSSLSAPALAAVLSLPRQWCAWCTPLVMWLWQQSAGPAAAMACLWILAKQTAVATRQL